MRLASLRERALIRSRVRRGHRLSSAVAVVALTALVALTGCVELFVDPPSREAPIQPEAGAPDGAVPDDGVSDDAVPDGVSDDGVPDAAPDAAVPDAFCPARPERCDGVDDDCDGRVDECFPFVCCAADDTAPPCNGCPTGTRRPPAGWVCIPPGVFTMGHAEVPGATPHAVTIRHPYWMMATEVTRAEWREVARHADPAAVEADPAWFADRSRTCQEESETLCPVERVSWLDATWHAIARAGYDGLEPCYGPDPLAGCDGSPHGGCPDDGAICYAESHAPDAPPFGCDEAAIERWSAVELRCAGYRLPTEAEWAHAHQGGLGNTRFWRGDHSAVLDDIAWYADNSNGSPHQVGIAKELDDGLPAWPPTPERPALHPWGLHDTHGNVAEWVHDAWIDRFDDTPAEDPRGPPAAGRAERVIRGCSWDGTAEACRSASRDFEVPDARANTVGFRLVRPVVPRVEEPSVCPP